MLNKGNYQNIDAKTLQNLLVKSQKGEKKSFNKLSVLINEISYSYFISKHKMNKIKSKEEVEDLTNNVCLSFTEQYTNIINIEHWLRKVLFLQFVNWYKKAHRYEIFELNETIDSEKNSNIDEDFNSQRVTDCLNKLSEVKKEIIKMKFWGGLKFKEIAERLSKNENAIKKMYYRTLEELKKLCD